MGRTAICSTSSRTSDPRTISGRSKPVEEIIMAAQEIPLVGYQPKLLNRVEVAEGTMAFHFEKPPGFDFKPGQSVDLTLLNPRCVCAHHGHHRRSDHHCRPARC